MAEQQEAGPSHYPLILPPLPSSTSHIHSTQDLVSRFRLNSAYDSYVRPYVRPANELPDPKGKGKEIDPTSDHATDKSRVRIAHGLKSFLNDLPSKISTKKSASIADLLLAAPKQRVDISSFDARTLEHFVLQPGPIQYRNPPIVVEAETEKKKKKKKRLDDTDGAANHTLGGNLASPIPPHQLPQSPYSTPLGVKTKIRKEREEGDPNAPNLTRPPKKRKMEPYPFVQQPTPHGLS